MDMFLDLESTLCVQNLVFLISVSTVTPLSAWYKRGTGLSFGLNAVRATLLMVLTLHFPGVIFFRFFSTFR